MRSEKIREFWRWFKTVAEELAAAPLNPDILEELDWRIERLHPGLAWEIGPGSHAAWQLVISPNLDPALRRTACKVVSLAPEVADWEFSPMRRPKEWNFEFTLQLERGGSIHVDASRWRFVLLRHADGSYEILLQGSSLPPMTDRERWHAATVVLESILGEQKLMEFDGEYELVDRLDGDFARRARPIRDLLRAFSDPSETV
jgi:hypothetical protein